MRDNRENGDAEIRLKLVCVDRRVQEDLLFMQTLSRSFERSQEFSPMVLIVGSAEPAERALAADGFNVGRQEGALVLSTQGERTIFERVMREQGRKYVQLLTDAGIPSVGFFGADRGILRRTENGKISPSGVQTVAALSRSGVVSVLLCGGLDNAENVVDLHPTTVCRLFEKQLPLERYCLMGDIVLLVAELHGKMAHMTDEQPRIRWNEVMKMGLKFDEIVASFAVSMTSEFYVSSALHIAENRGLRVGS